MKMKKFIAGIMAVCVMSFCVPYVNLNTVVTTNAVSDYTEETYEFLTYKNYGDYIEISKCSSYATEVVIPEMIDGIPVTSIGEKAFYECRNLTSVNIPDSVKSIGNFAFCYCSSLKFVNIPDGITHIGVNMLAFCKGLKSVKIPDSVISIDDYAFYGCTELRSIEIPDSVASIGGYSFYKTQWLEEKRQENPLVIINDILIDGEACFGSVAVPDTIKRIGHGAFAQSELTSIIIPESVTVIQKSAFSSCPELEEITILNPECDIYDDCYTITSKFEKFYGVICGYDYSTAQTYAWKYNKAFRCLKEEISTATGDLNGDGDANIADAVLLQKYILGGQEITEEQFRNADLTGDGYVDSFDMVLLKKEIIS